MDTERPEVAPPILRLTITIRKSLWEKLDELTLCVHPPMGRRYFLRNYFLPQFEDWLDKFLDLHKPEDGSKVSVEKINIFPAVLVERKRRIWRKK